MRLLHRSLPLVLVWLFTAARADRIKDVAGALQTAPPNQLAPTLIARAATSCATGSDFIVSPTPAGSYCGVYGVSIATSGSGELVEYTSGVQIANIEGCASQCLFTPCCTNIYFDEGVSCALHYGPSAVNTDPIIEIYQYYDATCFTCGDLSCSTTVTPTSTSSTAACSTVSGIVTPTLSGAICGQTGSSVAVTGGGLLVAYSNGSSIASFEACGIECLATSCCTNVYFIEGSNCNLHYGPNALLVGGGAFEFYDATCFTCGELSCLTTSSSIALTTPSSQSTSSTAVSSTTTSSTIQSTSTWAVTTTYTASSQCEANHLTMMIYSAYEIWDNAVIPVPTSTITTCLPSQFVASVLASASGTILPAFSELVCPDNWVTNWLNSTYIACCPADYVLALPAPTTPGRPAMGATCYSAIPSGATVTLTSYDATALYTTTPFVIPSTGFQAYANAFDGIAVNPSPTTTLPLNTIAKRGVIATPQTTAAPTSTLVTSAHSRS